MDVINEIITINKRINDAVKNKRYNDAGRWMCRLHRIERQQRVSIGEFRIRNIPE